MIIIGSAGSNGTHPAHTIAGLHEAISSGADMVQIVARLTRDKQLVLDHEFPRNHAYQHTDGVHSLTLKELQKRTAGSDQPIVTLRQALHICLGSIYVNVEIKDRGAGTATIELLMSRYASNLKNVMISSSSARELWAVRRRNKRIALGMLMHLNPYAFLVHERRLHLSAVGFHRLHIPILAIEMAHQMDMLVYSYTVNRRRAIEQLEEKGVDAVITDYPGKFAGE